MTIHIAETLEDNAICKPARPTDLKLVKCTASQLSMWNFSIRETIVGSDIELR